MNWPTLTPPAQPDGCVLFGVSRPDTVVDVTRIAVLMSHYYGALPIALHVALGEEPTWEGRVDLEGERLFELARTEATSLGYPLRSYSEFAAAIAAGIKRAADSLQPRVLVLGRSYGRGAPGFARIADSVSDGEPWPLILIRFHHADHFGRALVPLANPVELKPLLPVLSVLEEIGCPTTVLETAPSVDAILGAVANDDLIVMHTADCGASPSALSCELADELAERTDLPILLVRGDLRPKYEAA